MEKKEVTKVDFILCGDAEIQAVVKKGSPHELEKWASQFNLGQLRIAIDALSEEKGNDKLFAIVKGLDKISTLETIGHLLCLKQLLGLQKAASENSEQSWKLFPIFVAIPHALFSQMLLEMSDEHKKQLQFLCASEPIQHHLLLFTHELKILFDENDQRLQKLLTEIGELDPSLLSTEALLDFKEELRQLKESIEQIIHKIENALLLAWNANNTLLIENLSAYRERFEKFLFTAIGHPHDGENASSGIFKALDDALHVIFNLNRIEKLDDSEPAIEALTCLSLHYAEDYWHVGLLPKVVDAEQLSLPMLNKDPRLHERYRHEVEGNLDRLGLKTVKDFKRHHLVSKKLLRDYVVANHKKIQ